MKRFNLAVFISLALGVACGLFLPELARSLSWIGDAYLSLLKIILLPLIITAILWAFCNPDVQGLGRTGLFGGAFYLLSSLAAAAIAVVLYGFWAPGALATQPQAVENHAASPGFLIDQLLPENLFLALAEGRILPVILFTLVLGLALWQIAPKARIHFGQTIEALHGAMMVITRWIILLTPLGAFSLMAVLVTRLNAEAFGAVSGFVLLVLTAGLLHALVSLPLLAWIFGRFNPWRYLMQVKEAVMIAFVTASSAAALPASLRVSQKAGVRASSSGLLLPLGATLNMDGSALYHALLALFLAHLSGADLLIGQQLLLIGVVMLSSAGTAAIPGGGIAMMAFVLGILGIDPAWLGLYLLIDRLLDNYITAVNVWGDLIAARAVDARAGKEREGNA